MAKREQTCSRTKPTDRSESDDLHDRCAFAVPAVAETGLAKANECLFNFECQFNIQS